MTTSNVDTVKRFYEIFASGDTSKLPEVLHVDIEMEMMNGWPYGGYYSGIKSAMEDFFANVWALLKPFTLETNEYLESGNVVIVLGTYHTPDKKTGEDVAPNFAHLWTVEDGKITRLRQYADTVQVSRALNHEVPDHKNNS